MIWWLWSQFAWVGSSVQLTQTRPRTLMLALTGLMLVASVMLPLGFEPGVSVFGIAYALIKLGSLVLYRLDTGGSPAHAARSGTTPARRRSHRCSCSPARS